MPSILAIVSKAVFEKEHPRAALGQTLPMHAYTSTNKALEPLRDGGSLFLVTVRPPKASAASERLWLVALLDSPKFVDGKWTATNTTPVTDITDVLAKLEMETSTGITYKAGALGMTLQTPRRIRAEGVDRLRALVGGARVVPTVRTPEARAKPAPVAKPVATSNVDAKLPLLELVRKLGIKGARAEGDELAIDAIYWARFARDIVPAKPVRTLRLLKALADDLEAALATPELVGIEELWLFRNKLTDRETKAIASSPYLTTIRRLDFEWCGMSGKTFAPLAAADPRRLPALRSLTLPSNRIGAVGARAFAQSLLCEQLTHLKLDHNHCGDEALAELLGSRGMRNMEELVLVGNEIADLGWAALANNPHAVRLVKVDTFCPPAVRDRLDVNTKAKRPWVQPDPPKTALVDSVRIEAPPDDGHGSELVAKLSADPDDAATRSVFRDWLEERGDPRSTLMMLAEQWEAAADDTKLGNKYEAARKRIEKAFGQRYKNKSAHLKWQHGMLVYCSGAQHWFIEHGPQILANEPVRSVSLDPSAASSMTELAAVPGIQRLAWISLGNATAKIIDAFPFAALPSTRLSLTRVSIGNHLAELMEATHFNRVRGLEMWRAPNRENLERIAGDERLAQLQRLEIGGYGGLDDEIGAVILRAPWKLEELVVNRSTSPVMLGKLRARIPRVTVA